MIRGRRGCVFIYILILIQYIFNNKGGGRCQKEEIAFVSNYK